MANYWRSVVNNNAYALYKVPYMYTVYNIKGLNRVVGGLYSAIDGHPPQYNHD